MQIRHDGGNGLFGIYIDNSAKADSLCFAFTDYQGNLVATAVSNQLLRRYAYDPWGNRRNAADWTQADTAGNLFVTRGYTFHEHLDSFKLINMNGRVYDPVLAAFLSPDPFVQMPDNWLNYNRYSYCFGNPLKYTDPTGELGDTKGTITGSDNSGVHWIEAANPGNWLDNEHLTYLERLCKDNGIKLTVYSGNDLPPLRGFNYQTATGDVPTPTINGVSVGLNTMGETQTNSSFWSEAQYYVPMWGASLLADQAWNEGNYFDYAGWMLMGVAEGLSLGMLATETQAIKAAAIPGARMAAGEVAKNTVTKTGTNISKHAAQRMAERGITNNMVETAISKGAKYFDPKNRTFNYVLEKGFASGKDLLIGVSPQTGQATTVIRGNNLVNSRFILQ